MSALVVEFVGGPKCGAQMAVRTDHWGAPPERLHFTAHAATPQPRIMYRRRQRREGPMWKYDFMPSLTV